MMIPVLLIQDDQGSDLENHLTSSTRVQVQGVFTAGESQRALGLEKRVPEVILVINLDTLDVETAVTTGLILRNRGYQVFIASNDDFAELIELMTDIHTYIVAEADRSTPVQTELLVTDHAIEVLGDVSSIVEYFEKEFLTEREDEDETDGGDGHPDSD